MAISGAHAGRRYPPTVDYEVSAAKITEFATALGDAGGQHAGAHAVAPPTFLAVIANAAWQAMFDDPELDLELRRVVHGDQRFTFARPLRPGDRVSAALTIDQVRSRGPADIITASVEVQTSDGALVGTATATFFHTREPAADGATA